jgi:hypothetical protein
MRLGSLLVAAALCACTSAPAEEGPGTAGDPVAPSHEPIHFPRPGGPREANLSEHRQPSGDEAGWQEKLDLAQRYAAGGYDEEALGIVDGALRLAPPAPYDTRFRDLKAALRMRRAETSLLRAEARGARDYAPFGADVDFVVRLRNVARREIVIPAPEDATSSPPSMTLTVSRVDRDAYAAELRRAWTTTVPLLRPGQRELRLAAGASVDLPVRVPAEDVGGALAGIRVLAVEGTVRPSGLRIGEDSRSVRVRVRRGRVVVLPEGYEPIARDPLGSLRTAIDTAAPVHLLVATEFLSGSERLEASPALAGALDAGPPAVQRAAVGAYSLVRERAAGEALAPWVDPLIARMEARPEAVGALMEGITALTDVRLAPDARLWTDWWRRTRLGSPRIEPPPPVAP